MVNEQIWKCTEVRKERKSRCGRWRGGQHWKALALSEEDSEMNELQCL